MLVAFAVAFATVVLPKKVVAFDAAASVALDAVAFAVALAIASTAIVHVPAGQSAWPKHTVDDVIEHRPALGLDGDREGEEVGASVEHFPRLLTSAASQPLTSPGAGAEQVLPPRQSPSVQHASVVTHIPGQLPPPSTHVSPLPASSAPLPQSVTLGELLGEYDGLVDGPTLGLCVGRPAVGLAVGVSVETCDELLHLGVPFCVQLKVRDVE